MGKLLGVIGGVGPLATAYFMEVLIRKTDAETDQDHVEMIILNHSTIPNRTDYILDQTKPNPIPVMCEDAKKLEKLGCNVLVIPCNTAHTFHQEIQEAVGVPVLHMVEETAKTLSAMTVKRAGVLATTGTVKTELFQHALSRQGISCVLPIKEEQAQVMELIDHIKADIPVNRTVFDKLIESLKKQGCECVVLGCTELSILKKEFSLDSFFVDTLEVLCEKAIIACGKSIRK